MSSADRKLVSSIAIVLGIISIELAWLIFVGPSTISSSNTAGHENLAWWDSAAFWTAAFTLALTFSTALLWRETRRLAKGAEVQAEDTRQSLSIARMSAEAAQKSADAAIGAERAWLLPTVDGDNLESAVLQRIDPHSWVGLTETEPLRPEVRFHFNNHGKTPGFIREAAMELVISIGVPERVLATPTAPWWPEEIIVPAGGRYPVGEDDYGKLLERITQVHGTFGEDQAKLFEPENGPDERPKFWFYGHVLYTDVWNNLHMTRFCLASEVWSGWYMPPEAMEYNQRT